MTSQDLGTEAVGQLATSWNGSLEEAILSINAIAPDVLECLPGLFEDAVRESVARTLGATESECALTFLNRVGFANRSEVFRSLNSIYGRRASPLLKAVDRSFRVRVNNLARQMM